MEKNTFCMWQKEYSRPFFLIENYQDKDKDFDLI